MGTDCDQMRAVGKDLCFPSCQTARQFGQARLVRTQPRASIFQLLTHYISRIQALEAQVQDLLRSQNPGPVTQQPLPETSPLNLTGAVPAGSSAANIPAESDVVDEDVVTLERANTLVELYKSDMMPHFPFIIIPPHITGSHLREEKPFLFLAVLSVASYHDLATQEKLGDRFKYLVSDKVLLGGDESLSLDYLQGLLVVLAW